MFWDYTQPVRIIFGCRGISRLPELLSRHNCERGLLVSSPFFVRSGLAEELQKQSHRRICGVFSHITPNPEVTQVDEGAAVARSLKADWIIALGGGSAIDCAKAIALMTLHEGSIAQYHGTGSPVPDRALPLIAIPSTSGTGSEVTKVSVLSNSEAGIKNPIISECFYPQIALIDPELTHSATPHTTASCGIDVLCHALEGYWSKGNQPICSLMGAAAIELVMKYLFRAYEDSRRKADGSKSSDEGIEAREKMAEAAVLAGLAFGLPKTTAAHACSYPLSEHYHIPHGEACGLSIDYFLRINSGGKRVQQLALRLGYCDCNEFADAIFNLKKQIGLRTNLKEFHLSTNDITNLVRNSQHPNLKNNPVEISEKMLYDLFEPMC